MASHARRIAVPSSLTASSMDAVPTVDGAAHLESSRATAGRGVAAIAEQPHVRGNERVVAVQAGDGAHTPIA